MKRFLPILISCLIMFLCFIVLSISLLFISPDLSSHRDWKGYYTLLIDSPPDDSIQTALTSIRGVRDIVSEYSSKVEFNTFEGFESIEITLLKDRLESIDPRYDPYLQSVSKYFYQPQSRTISSSGYLQSTLYIRSETNAIFMAFRLYRLFKLFKAKVRHWRLMEFDSASKVLHVILFCIFLSVLMGFKKSSNFNYLVILGSFPWFIRILLGGLLDLLGFFILYPLWIYLLEFVYLFFRKSVLLESREPPERKASRRFLLLFLIFTVVNILICFTASRFLLKNIITLGANLSMIPLLYLFLLAIRRYREHAIFEPLSILQRFLPKDIWIRRSDKLTLLLVLVVLFSLPLAAIEKKFFGISRPVPQIHRGSGDISWSSLQSLFFLKTENGLPDLSDYIAHRAFQEGIAFGRPYRFPVSGERLIISRYLSSYDGDKIIKTAITVKKYQPAWLVQTLKQAPAGSVQRMLLDQDRPVQVIIEHELMSFTRDLPWLKLLLVSIFIISFLFIKDFYLTPFIMYGTRNLITRRSP